MVAPSLHRIAHAYAIARQTAAAIETHNTDRGPDEARIQVAGESLNGHACQLCVRDLIQTTLVATDTSAPELRATPRDVSVPEGIQQLTRPSAIRGPPFSA